MRKEHAVFFGHTNATKDTLSVIDNLRFWATLYGAQEREIGGALDALSLKHLHDRRVETLSAGQQRRVGFCRVLLSNKKTWLLDEPTASMDADAVAVFKALVSQHVDEDGSVLIATHDNLDFADAHTYRLDQSSQAASAR